MSGLTLRLIAPSKERLDLSGLTPGRLAALSAHEIGHIRLGQGKQAVALGDVFYVTGSAGDSLTIEGDGGQLDSIGAELDAGTILIRGNVGDYAGRKMKGGKLEIEGNAGGFLASGMTGGTVRVRGDAGDHLGAAVAGDRFGLQGGMVVIGGNIGHRAGEKMRRGTVVVRGRTGEGAGTRMIGGTIWADGGIGPAPGLMMRRGTLIGPSVDRLLPTFVDCGKHDLVIVRILNRYVKSQLGDLAPKPMPLFVRKIAGDMSTIGRGEILLPAT